MAQASTGRPTASGAPDDKRTRPPAPAPAVTLAASAVVGANSSLAGPHAIEVGAQAIIHPYARLSSHQGRVEIGAGSIVWERAVVGAAGSRAGPVVVGRNVSVESDAVVEAGCRVGDGSVVEAGAIVRAGALVGRHCKINPGSDIGPDAPVPDFTVVSPSGHRRRDATLESQPDVMALKMKCHARQLEILARLVDNHASKWT